METGFPVRLKQRPRRFVAPSGLLALRPAPGRVRGIGFGRGQVRDNRGVLGGASLVLKAVVSRYWKSVPVRRGGALRLLFLSLLLLLLFLLSFVFLLPMGMSLVLVR